MRTDAKKLTGKQIAILATDGFEESELMDPKKALEKAGATVHVISLKSGKIKSWKNGDWGVAINVDKNLFEADEATYDGLVLPGGVLNADKIRGDQVAIDFVAHFVDAEKPIAAICHAPWTLIETGAVQGRQMTSWPSLKTDLMNAGAEWLDQAVVVDRGWITSRKPADLSAFNAKMIEEFMKDSTPVPSRKVPSSQQELGH